MQHVISVLAPIQSGELISKNLDLILTIIIPIYIILTLSILKKYLEKRREMELVREQSLISRTKSTETKNIEITFEEYKSLKRIVNKVEDKERLTGPEDFMDYFDNE